MQASPGGRIRKAEHIIRSLIDLRVSLRDKEAIWLVVSLEGYDLQFRFCN